MVELALTKKQEISSDLTELLLMFAVKFSKPFERHVKCEYSPLQMNILLHLGLVGPYGMTQFRHALRVSKQQMTALIDDLVEDHLIERVPDTQDRRNIILKITEVGLTYLEQQKEEATAILNYILNDLEEVHVDNLMRAVKEVNSILSTLPDYQDKEPNTIKP